MIFPIEIDPLVGVFGFLDGTLPEKLRKAAEETDLGIGRLSGGSSGFWSAMFSSPNPPLGVYESGDERRAIAKILNHSFRLQWNECPLRPFLAKYHLFYRDDMADALAAAYCLHSRMGSECYIADAGTNQDFGLLRIKIHLLKVREVFADLGKFSLKLVATAVVAKALPALQMA